MKMISWGFFAPYGGSEGQIPAIHVVSFYYSVLKMMGFLEFFIGFTKDTHSAPE
jgi:hypothetical protein